jgi:hypothetical protein
MAPTTSKKFYAIHGTHKDKIFTKWFGKGGAEQATKHRGDLTFHGFIDRGAAGYYLTIPNVEAAQDWAKTHGKSKKWNDFAPEIGEATDTAAAVANDISGSSSETPSSPPTESEEDPPPASASQYDELFATDIIGGAREDLMKLCVKIAQVQLGPDKDLWKLSLLWLQRAETSEKGAIAHFMKQLLHNNDTATSIVEYKALAKSLQTNTWKYVYEARDILRKEVITSTVALDRARANYTLSLDDLELSNTKYRDRIIQLEGTITSLERTGRKATKKIKKLEGQIEKLQLKCIKCGTTSLNNSQVYCGDCAQGSSIEYISETEVEENHNHEAAAETHSETARRQEEEASDQSYANQLNQERLVQIQELVTRSLEHLKVQEQEATAFFGELSQAAEAAVAAEKAASELVTGEKKKKLKKGKRGAANSSSKN